MAFVAILIVFPIGWTIFLSLTNSRGSVRAPLDFIGLENYLTVLTDTERFWPAVGRTVFFTGGALIAELVLGMAIALLLWRPFKGQGLVRVAILLPLVATPVAVGMMWRLIFEPNIGFANQMLGWFGIPAQPWLSGQNTALPTLMFVIFGNGPRWLCSSCLPGCHRSLTNLTRPLVLTGRTAGSASGT